MEKWKKNKIVEEMLQIHSLNDLKLFLQDRGSTLKKLLLPVIVAVSLIFFWTSGNREQELQVTSSDPEGQSVSVSRMDAADAGSLSETDPDTAAGENADSPAELYVDIGGEVVHPGVYQVAEGTRLFQVIEKAGGLKDSADTDSINQAEPVSDGQKIIIGSLNESSPYYTGSAPSSAGSEGQASQGGQGSSAGRAVRETDAGTIVNINLADLSQLQLLPGVGPSTAQKIVDYRQQNGNFQRIEDIMNISGIGEKTFENLKDFIEI